jgi:beta-hydroxylase
MAARLGEKFKRRLYLLGRKVVWGIDDLYTRNSRLGAPAFFDPALFPWIPRLEAATPAIRRELDALLGHFDHLPNFQDLSPDQRFLTTDSGWKTYFFYAYGIPIWKSHRRCPETVRALRAIPGMKTAFFSILAPRKRLPVHRGPYKGVLRLHLALRIPEPREQCGIRVGGEVRHWDEGKAIVFDDCLSHEAWNDTDGVRVVLFVDIVRPLRFPASLVNWLLTWAIALSPFVLGTAGRHLAWERRFERIVNAPRPGTAPGG